MQKTNNKKNAFREKIFQRQLKMTNDFTTIKMEAIDNGRVILNPEFYRQKSFKSDLNANRVI